MTFNPLKPVKQVQALANNIIRIRQVYAESNAIAPPVAELVIEMDAKMAFDLAGAINHNVINNIATN